MTKILVVSDTHSQEKLIGCLPEAEILIHAGDFMNSGRYVEEITSFNSWLGGVPIEHKLIGFGNHDIRFDETHRQSSPKVAVKAREALTNGRFFQDESVVVRGIKFYFSPWTPEFLGWGFNATREQLKENWKKIPDDTEFLVTHGPPYGILDQAVKGGEHLGDIELLHRVKQLSKLKYHVFGHIHGSRGIAPSVWGPTFCNCSFLNEQYRPHSGPGYTLLEVN
jgi:predicted phosphodiesterase